MNKRYEELDSIRGLAASTVVIHHLILAIPAVFLLEKLKHTPLHIFWAGHEAVILFFILSGFVLSLSYHNNKVPKYKDYLIKRVCRIYIPYVVSILFAITLMTLFSRGGIPELSKAFNEAWNKPLSLTLLLEHIFMLGQFSIKEYNSVIWSLVHEMRISIIFPFLMYFVVRFGWKRNLMIGFICSGIYFITWYICIKYFGFDVIKSETSFILTIHYIGFFILGALLAKHREKMREIYLTLSKVKKMLLLLTGILSYTYTWWFFPKTSISDYLHFTFINDWAISLGSSILIILTINSDIIKKFLHLKLIQFIGKVSYSLYLFHWSVELSLFYLLYGKISLGIIIVFSFFLSIMMAGIMYYLIEHPSNLIGKMLTGKKMVFKKSKIKEIKKQYV